MKKYLLLCFFAIIAVHLSFAQKQSQIHYTDNAGKRVSSKKQATYYQIMVQEKDNPDHVHFTEYYISGNVHITGSYRSYKKQIKEGLWVAYYETGEKKSETTYRTDQQGEIYFSWYKNGNPQEKYTLLHYYEIDTSKIWYENGQLTCAIPFVVNGESSQIANDTIISFAEDGKIKRKTVYSAGKEIRNTCYDSTGTQIRCTTPFIKRAEYKGGQQAMNYYLTRNMRYPSSAIQNGIQGRVVVSFVIDTEGKIQQAMVQEGLSLDTDAEALRIITQMPAWKPAYRYGKAVPQQFSLPISFNIVTPNPARPPSFSGR